MRAIQSDRQVAWQAAIVHVCHTDKTLSSLSCAADGQPLTIVHKQIPLRRYKSNCQIEFGVDGSRTCLANRGWKAEKNENKKYAEIKLPELEKSQTSETHKSRGAKNFKRPTKKSETKEIVTAI